MLQKAYQSLFPEAGCDEAGRGCLAGPVFAASVIFPKDYYNSQIQDSKKLSEKKRDGLRGIIEKEALTFSVHSIEAPIIDQVNILKASIQAMHQCIDSLSVRPNHIIIDGNYFLPFKEIPYTCLVKGDSRFLSIAAASILAKTYRDEFMREQHQYYPEYGWDQNKGYPSLHHRIAIHQWGISPFHRKSFRLG